MEIREENMLSEESEVEVVLPTVHLHGGEEVKECAWKVG